MTDRVLEITAFLARCGWESAQQMPMDADFSPRRYARLMHEDGRRAILMDADRDQKTQDFIMIARLLREFHISAPEIFAAEPQQGLVLMEDFGNRNLGRTLDAGTDAKTLYLRATDVLIHLHKNFDRAKVASLDLPIFSGALFASQAELFLDVWFPYVTGRDPTGEEAGSFYAAIKTVLKGIDKMPQTLILRDFMPDNLMELPKREGWQAIGVLDFQDAGLGPIAYDLASLCEVVRRDGGDTLMADVILHYHEETETNMPLAELTRACHILSAQRHLRILGIIARLIKKTGRREKLDYVPRINAYLERLLKDDALQPLKEWMATSGPRT